MMTEVVAGSGARERRPSFRHLFIDCDDERLQRRYTEQTSGQHPAGMLSDLPLRDRADPCSTPPNRSPPNCNVYWLIILVPKCEVLAFSSWFIRIFPGCREMPM